MKLKHIKRVGSTVGRFPPKNFPALNDEEKLYLQGLVHDSLEQGRTPSTDQQRMIAHLIKKRLLVGKPDKEGRVTYRPSEWGMQMIGMDPKAGNDAQQTFTARSSPH